VRIKMLDLGVNYSALRSQILEPECLGEVSTTKRPDFIVQDVSNETLYFYRTGCLQ
jgi:hypothetical protein